MIRNSIFLFTFLLSSLLFAQNQNEKREVIDNEDSFEIYIRYVVSEDEFENVQADITAILGEKVGRDIWSSFKAEDKYVTVKMLNGYVFLRGFDSSSNLTLKPTLLALDQELSKYKD